MTLKDPVLLRTAGGIGFLDYWFSRAGKGKGCSENSDGGFSVQISEVGGVFVARKIRFPKTARGFCGIMGQFEFEGSFYQVSLRGLVEYVCDNDKYLKVKVDGLPDVLARDWKSHVGGIIG